MTAMNSRLEGMAVSRRLPVALVTLAVLLAALAIRLWLMPPLYNQPRSDEEGYMIDGLLMLEGATPGFKFAPGAATIWPGFVYGGLSSLAYLLNPTDEIAHQPAVFKPLFAIDRALFDAYADLSGLRAVVMGTVLATTMFGVLMACRLGAFRAGWPGALLCGGLMASVPIIATLSVQTKPYAAAWSLGIAAVACSATLTGRWRWIGAGLCFGLAVASRIEVVLIAPLIVWEFWLRPEQTATIRALMRVVGISVLAFYVAAPWYIPHFLGNVRKTLTVPFEFHDEGSVGVDLFNLLWNEGLLPVVVLLLIGLAMRLGRQRILLAAAAGLYVIIVLVIFGGGGLSKYNGAAWISIIALAPFALGAFQERLPPLFAERLAGLVALLLVIPCVVQTIHKGLVFRASWVEPKVVEWLTENVPAGTLIYDHPTLIKAVPPTKESAERNWSEVASVDEWQTKLRERLSQTDLNMDRLPRALSLEHMYQRLGAARREFFLASDYWGAQPRYDVIIRGYVYTPLTTDNQLYKEFVQTGGVLLHYGEPLTLFGDPAAAWTAEDGTGMFLYLRLADDPKDDQEQRGVP